MTPQTPNNSEPTVLPSKPKPAWYAQTWFTVVMLIFFAPVGWFLTWRYRTWGIGGKIVATVLSLMLFASAMSHKSSNSTSTSNTDTSASATSAPPDTPANDAPPPADVTISASALEGAYHANEVAADEKYKDKDLLVSGVVESIGKDVTDTSFVTLQTEQGPFFSVQCMFDDQYKSQLAQLSKGERVKIRGTCKGATLGTSVLIADSSLQ